MKAKRQEKILEIENHHTRITDTHAVWKESKAKEIIAGEEHIICDTVNFKYMEANASYTMKGILMDADTGTILYNKGMDEKRYPASITKIMTALLALENSNLDDQVTFTEECLAGIL